MVSIYMLTVLVAISLLGLSLSKWTERHYVASLTSDLTAESRFIGELVLPLNMGSPAIDELAKRASRSLGCRVTIIQAGGTVIGESDHDFRTMESHKNRPEVRAALSSGTGSVIRKSSTIRTRMLYVASSLRDNKGRVVVVRVAENLAQVDRVLGNIARVFLITTLIAIAFAALIGYIFASRIIRRILSMNAAARRIAKGDLKTDFKVPDVPCDEIDELAIVLNSMSKELRFMMDELAEEKNMLETILARTDDGLVVVDKDARIRMVNPAAERLLGAMFSQIEGKTVIEGTLNHDLSELAARVLRTGLPASLEVEISSPKETHLNVYVASLERPGGDFGAVIVMHDLSETRRIDSIRRDFVANVSHEFRTPLASIRVMAETIILRGKKDPEKAAYFAEKIMGEADRLTALSDDLLDLAKIEAGMSIAHREKFSLAEITDRIVAQFVPVAAHKGVGVTTEVSPDVIVNGDSDAVYQILLNLVDNAVKYTPEGGHVLVSATTGNDRVTVKVADTGIGIPAQDLSRIFERFYRVDRARSRESGGTGLGLSIVKHLVEAHGGRVTIDSTPGSGTTFTVTLPA